MAVYANSAVRFFHGTDKDVMETQIAAYILTLDATTHPVIGIFQLGDGVMVVAGA
jgi:hypothetical protein